ncbi:MFS transporter [Rathayibacter soli]|uniref:MFS transporter n=1 Tax=Rathayibacter soli TaxID=3144168 RepID=UPI0027E515A6|nr:MFS transporter [Glaciibacter superstes]
MDQQFDDPAGPLSASRLSSTYSVAHPARIGSRAALIYLAVCIVLIALNVRTLFSSFSAILPEIVAATGMPALLVGVLTTAPVLLLGLCAPLAPLLARHFGVERVMLACMMMLTLGLAARGLGADSALLAGTLACGAAIAVVNVLLPELVKRDFRHRLGLMSGLYTGAMFASAAMAAAFTHPVYESSGSWQFALSVWAIPALIVVVLFVPLAWRRTHGVRMATSSGVSVWRSGTAWQVTIFMVLQAMTSFSVFAWLAPILRQRGVDGGTAGLMVAVCILLQVIGSIVAPVIAVRCADQRALNVVIALLAGFGFALCVFGPMPAVWVWIVVLGVGQGGMTALALTMIVLRTRSSDAASRLSGMMQGVGYGVGSSGTLLVALLYQSTGSFTAAGLMFVAVGIVGAWFGYGAGRTRFVEER